MGYDLLVTFFALILTPAVLAGFVVFWMMNARDHEELAACWKTYAARRGLGYVAPEGEWPNRTAPAMTWTDGGAQLRITAIGKEASVRTRLTIRPQAALLGTLSMSVGAAGDGDGAVRERPAGFGARIVTESVRKALLAFRQHDHVTLGYRRGRVAVEWPGGERNDARLDEARRLGNAIARAIDDELRAGSVASQPAA